MSNKAKKSAPQINRLVVIGLGLIGSSLAIAARQRGIAQRVVGISRRSSTLELALEAGIIDEAGESLDGVVCLFYPTEAADQLDGGSLRGTGHIEQKNNI